MGHSNLKNSCILEERKAVVTQELDPTSNAMQGWNSNPLNRPRKTCDFYNDIVWCWTNIYHFLSFRICFFWMSISESSFRSWQEPERSYSICILYDVCNNQIPRLSQSCENIRSVNDYTSEKGSKESTSSSSASPPNVIIWYISFNFMLITVNPAMKSSNLLFFISS